MKKSNLFSELPLFKDTVPAKNYLENPEMIGQEKERFDKISRWLFPELYEDEKRKPLLSAEIEFMKIFE